MILSFLRSRSCLISVYSVLAAPARSPRSNSLRSVRSLAATFVLVAAPLLCVHPWFKFPHVSRITHHVSHICFLLSGHISFMKTLSIALTLATLITTARAENWAQWRGPFFNGSTTEGGLPTEFSKTKN